MLNRDLKQSMRTTPKKATVAEELSSGKCVLADYLGTLCKGITYSVTQCDVKKSGLSGWIKPYFIPVVKK